MHCTTPRAGFVGEVKAKYTAQMAEVFRETFCWLPLGYVLAGKVLVVSAAAVHAPASQAALETGTLMRSTELDAKAAWLPDGLAG